MSAVTVPPAVSVPVFAMVAAFAVPFTVEAAPSVSVPVPTSTLSDAEFCVSPPVISRLPFSAAPVIVAPLSCVTAPVTFAVFTVPAAVCASVAAVMPSEPVTVIVPAPSCVIVWPVATTFAAVTSPATFPPAVSVSVEAFTVPASWLSAPVSVTVPDALPRTAVPPS